MTRRIELCPTDELPPGEKRIVDVEGLPHDVGVFNVDGEYYALANVCPHQLAPLCEGIITGEMIAPAVGDYELVRQGEIIQCPWHGWQFDITDGTSIFNPHELRTRSYDATVERTDADCDAGDECGVALSGAKPPIDSYPVGVEQAVVVLYI